jgi:hypothetical protein
MKDAIDLLRCVVLYLKKSDAESTMNSCALEQQKMSWFKVYPPGKACPPPIYALWDSQTQSTEDLGLSQWHHVLLCS